MGEVSPNGPQAEIARLMEAVERLGAKVERLESASENQSAHILAIEALMVAAARCAPGPVDPNLVSKLIVSASKKGGATIDEHTRLASEVAGRLIASGSRLL